MVFGGEDVALWGGCEARARRERSERGKGCQYMVKVCSTVQD